MQLFIWVPVGSLEALDKFIKYWNTIGSETAVPSFNEDVYVSQPQWAAYNAYCQVLIGYDDYVRLQDCISKKNVLDQNN